MIDLNNININEEDPSFFTESDVIKDSKNEEEFIKKLRKETLKAKDRQRDNIIKDLQSDVVPRRRTTSTKIFMYFILINCSIVEIYSMAIMYVLKDLSALYSLIGAVVGESISFAIYCAKSFKETKEEAIITLERDKFESGIDSSVQPDCEITPPDSGEDIN